MKDKDVKLVEESIDRWERCSMGCITVEEFHAIECPLCDEYCSSGNSYYSNECLNCPIYKRTGEVQCYATPYRDWRMADSNGKVYDAIEAEIEFLVSLLPKEHKWRNE